MDALDRQQLSDVTLNDEGLMREIVAALVEDSSAKLPSIEAALQDADSDLVARLAHSSKGACANVGARPAAELFQRIEQSAIRGDLTACQGALAALAAELERLREAADSL